MSGSLVVAVVVVVGAALSISFALKSTDSNVGTESSPNTPSSQVESAEAETVRLNLVGICESAGGSSSYCGCFSDQIIAAGYDSLAKYHAIASQIPAAVTTGNSSSVSAEIMAARNACASLR